MSGRLLKKLIEDERSGKFKGQTVQVIPHLTQAIEDSIKTAAKGYDIHVVELGGTVGDYESLAFVEAFRRLTEENYSSFWRQIANDDKSINSAYGNLIFKQHNEHGISQWQWAMRSLIQDKDTRQAVMMFNKPQYQYGNNKDFICTLSGIFAIRNNRLNLTITMRSNDVVLGTPTDVAFFCMLLQQAHKLLKEYYPDLKLGKYTHIANSYHLYERHFDLVDDMLKTYAVCERMPNIGINLIDIDGNPSPELIHLMNVVEFGGEYESTDPLLSWVYEKLTK
jgi:thymidylate synthase